MFLPPFNQTSGLPNGSERIRSAVFHISARSVVSSWIGPHVEANDCGVSISSYNCRDKQYFCWLITQIVPAVAAFVSVDDDSCRVVLNKNNWILDREKVLISLIIIRLVSYYYLSHVWFWFFYISLQCIINWEHLNSRGLCHINYSISFQTISQKYRSTDEVINE